MVKGQTNEGSHTKLKIFGIALLVLVLGFFIYKYTYIYLERRKYAQAEQAIIKVADDLRAQGVVTEFSKGCGRNQGVFGPGALSCSIILSSAGSTVDSSESSVYRAIGSSAIIQGFKLKESNDFIVSDKLTTNHTIEFIFSKNNLGCELFNDHTNRDKFIVYFSCLEHLKFKIY